MGGVPVLLMMAAVGITFGWQPDNDGGVEYIIQIPPDQVHELEHLGEISSVIDPAVQGHVSRVIIRVGNSTPPRITPRSLTGTGSRLQGSDRAISVSDQSPVPIPEMDDNLQAIPIPSLDSTAATSLHLNQAAVLKPDANDPANGPGFSLPSVPSSLRHAATQTAEGIRSNVDRAGRDVGARASSGRGTLTPDPAAALRKSLEDARNGILVPPPATRTPKSAVQAQPPQFTGSDPTGEMARVRPGGPSTDPTNARNNSWRNLAGPPRSGASTEPVGPSGFDSNNPFDNRRVDAQANSVEAHSNRRGASGLAPSDTFGKMPGGLSLPSASPDLATGYTDRNAYPDSPSARSPSTRGRSRDDSQYEQTQLDRQSGYAGAHQEGRQQYEALGSGQRTSDGNDGQVRSGAFHPLPGRDQQRPQPNRSTDSRLTAAEIAAGAWTVDVYGRAIDREGRLVEATSPPDSTSGMYAQPRAPLGQSRAPLGQPRASVGQTRTPTERYADRTYGSSGGPDPDPPAFAATSMTNVPSTLGQPPYGYGQTSPSKVASGAETNFVRETDGSSRSDSFPRSETARREATSERQLEPPSLSTRQTAPASTAIDSSRQRVAAQPLFNGLLLISFVANVYLIFWLKNLRIQFRELVAAKRMANSNNVQ